KGGEAPSVLYLHSVHFLGDLYEDDALTYKDTDVCSELDLLGVLVNPGKTSYQYFGLGNVKVTASSAKKQAQQQNADERKVLDAGAQGKDPVIDEAKRRTAKVKRIYGHDVKDSSEVDMTGKLSPASEVTHVTIGAQDKAKHGYDTVISLTYD